METKFPDGRTRAYVIPTRAQQPTKPRNSIVRMLIENFERTGESQHSGAARLLQYLIDYCEENKIDYIIQAAPGRGYAIKKADWNVNS